MPTLKPIKVTLRRKPEGGALWPVFKNLDPAIFDGKRPGAYFDGDGIGWHYDKAGGLGSGADTGTAVTAIPVSAADGILASGIPDVVGFADEAEFEDFYDNKAHIHEADSREDHEALQAIVAKRNLGMKETANDLAALDPDNPIPGIRKNHSKTWQRFKAKRNITLAF